LALKYGEDRCKGVARLKLRREGMGEEVLLRLLLVSFDGGAEDCLKVGRG
jgi:hypothetical protein